MALFPIFVKLEGRQVLVVGGGPIAESKLTGLMTAGAHVTLVAPEATPAIAALAEQGAVSWHRRIFHPDDLEGAALVIAAVPRDVAESVYAHAHRRGILVNSVDDPDNCDFYYPAVVSRGDFQIAISTAGHSPALAQRVRIELERQFGPEYERWVQQLGDARRQLFASEPDAEERKRKLHELAAGGARQSAVSDRSGRAGMVYLVGAGPGDPELLTLKALRILGQADVVLHDDLLTDGILELIPAHARVESVGKRHGERTITQEDINRRLVRYGTEGRSVVRLKGGDGTIFGRASEEIEALRAAGVPFTIVPGVTAASGAAAAAGVSLTDRRAGSALVFLTAQRCKGNPPPNWRAIAALGGTAAIYMPGGHEADVAAQLLEAGLHPETSCLVIASATRPEERLVETTLSGLSGLPVLPPPAVLLIGVMPSRHAPAATPGKNVGKHASNH